MKEHFRALRQVLQLWSEDKLGESAPETWAHFQQRVAEARAAIRHGGQRVLAVSGGPIAVTVQQVLAAAVERDRAEPADPQQQPFAVFFNAEAFHLASFNGIPHLEDPERHAHLRLTTNDRDDDEPYPATRYTPASRALSGSARAGASKARSTRRSLPAASRIRLSCCAKSGATCCAASRRANCWVRPCSRPRIRVLSALSGTAVPVAHPYHLRRPRRDRQPVRDELRGRPDLSGTPRCRSCRRPIARPDALLLQTMAALHDIDVDAVGLPTTAAPAITSSARSACGRSSTARRKPSASTRWRR